MAQLQRKPLHWTKWKRKYKGPIGHVLVAPCTCKWYTLSGRPSTSSHSCCCCWAECISQGWEGWWTAHGEVGVLKVYRGRLLGKRRWCSGQGLARSWQHPGFISLHKTAILPFDSPTNSIPSHSCFSSSIKRVWGWASPYLRERKRNKGLVAAIGHLTRLSQCWLQLIQFTPILEDIPPLSRP